MAATSAAAPAFEESSITGQARYSIQAVRRDGVLHVQEELLSSERTASYLQASLWSSANGGCIRDISFLQSDSFRDFTNDTICSLLISTGLI
jgi:hypothetical protein